MNSDERKTAVSAYKEREPVAGIFAIRCPHTGEAWVGRAPDVDKIQNRMWFTLKQGTHPHRALQAAWSAHGEDALVFEVVERLEKEELAFARARALKDRQAHWVEQLSAAAI